MVVMKKAIYLLVFVALLVVAAAGHAQTPGAPPPVGLGARIWQMMPMLLMVFLIFYILVIKPQNDQVKRQQVLLASLKKGQMVVTDSGLIGRVAGIEADYLQLEVAPNVRIKIEKAHIKGTREAKTEEK
jgi:preprotein translocase subunit YajC